jgi:YD repeat-containing protein
VQTFSATYDNAGGGVDVPDMPMHDGAWGPQTGCRGNALSVTAYVGGPRTRTYLYNIGGQVTSSNNGVTTVTVEQNASYSAPARITPNANENLAASMTWTSFLGLVSQTGPNNSTAAFTYDALARPSSATSPHGAVTSYTYANSPPAVTETVNGRWKKTTQDGLGRAVKVETGHGSTAVSVQETEYGLCACSPMGRVKRVSEPYAPGGTPVWTTYNYDARGRVTSVVAPDGAVTT